MIGDFFGGIGPGDLFGFAGNFLYGFIPYKAWEALTDGDPVPQTPLAWIAFAAVILLASAVCALTVGWGINLLGFINDDSLALDLSLPEALVSLAFARLFGEWDWEAARSSLDRAAAAGRLSPEQHAEILGEDLVRTEGVSRRSVVHRAVRHSAQSCPLRPDGLI